MQLNAEEREALKRPYHRCYGQERTENEINNFAVSCHGNAPGKILSAFLLQIKQRLEADGLILWNTVILLKYAMRYDNSHTTVLSGYIRSAKTQIAEIYSALENMVLEFKKFSKHFYVFIPDRYHSSRCQRKHAH